MPKIESPDQATEIEVDFLNPFKDANWLHSNFYEEGFSMDIVEELAEEFRRAVGQMLNMLPREVLEQ